jgi:hypothetical protein
MKVNRAAGINSNNRKVKGIILFFANSVPQK